MPHVCAPPAATAVQCAVPSPIAAGWVTANAPLPRPTAPRVSSPQQNRLPFASRPHACAAPTRTLTSGAVHTSPALPTQ
jgi:hypothetical protein